MSLTSIIGPLVMTTLFAWFPRPGTSVHFSGAPFLLGSVLLMGSALIAYSVLKTEKQHIQKESEQFSFEKTEV
jgi:MFS transporter, DHA1 family, tetracycline resistance protein